LDYWRVKLLDSDFFYLLRDSQLVNLLEYIYECLFLGSFISKRVWELVGEVVGSWVAETVGPLEGEIVTFIVGVFDGLLLCDFVGIHEGL
jgi:hypothetical protein